MMSRSGTESARRARGLALRLAACLGVAFAASSCGGGAGNGSELSVVGVVLPLSGPDAATGKKVLLGMQLAAAVQEDGGPPIRLLVLDGEGRPWPSVLRHRELEADESVIAAVGGWFSSTARPVAAAASGGDLPLLALSPGAAPRTATPGAGIVRLHRLEALGAAAAAFARQDLGAERAAVLHLPGRGASQVLVDVFVQVFRDEGGEIAWTAAPDAEGYVRPPAGTEAAAGEPVDVIWIAGPAGLLSSPALLGESVQEADWIVAEGWGSSTPAFGRTAGAGHLVAFWSATDPSDEARRFREACRDRGIDPTPLAATGWDAVVRIRAVLEQGGRTRAELERALRGGPPVEGATGKLGAEPGSGGRETPAISSITEAGEVFLRRVEAPVPKGWDEE